MKRKEFLQVGIPAFLLLANGKIIRAGNFVQNEAERQKVKLRFVVASDGHYGQKDTDYQNFHNTIISRINEEHAKQAFSFCVINGDIIHDDKTLYTEAKKKLDTLHPKYYVSQGNHDHVTAEEWQAIWSMPVNLDFVVNDCAILIGTTSNEKGTYLCPDIPWFKSKLEQYKNHQNVFIFIHINPGKMTRYGVDCPEFFDLLDKHKNVRAIFNGHDHDEEGIKMKNGVPFIFDAHFGGDWGTMYHGFRIVELRNDNSILTYILNPTTRINEATISKSGTLAD